MTSRPALLWLTMAMGACSGKDDPAPRPADQLPVAMAPATARVDEDGTVRITLDGEDPDDSEAELTVRVTDKPEDGTLDKATGTAPLTLTYTPDEDFAGFDSLTFTVEEADGLTSAPHTVVFEVREGNDAPTARNDVAATDSVTAVHIDVLSNDTDPEGGPLAVTAVTQPSSGVVTLEPDGRLWFTPDHPTTGTLTFGYTVEDVGGATDDAEVEVTVTLGTPVSIQSFTGVPGVVELGEAIDLAWQTTLATSCQISPGVDIAGATTGTISDTPLTDTVYTLTCDGPGGPAEADVSVVVSPDTDGDGLLDVDEVALGYDPLDGDMDDDGLLDGVEDPNGNGIIDAGETDPYDDDSDADGILDGIEDRDGDGVVDAGESDPLDDDSDDDGHLDGDEDANRDGVLDAGETDPAHPDTDGDGQCDGPRADSESDGIDPSDGCVGQEGVIFVDWTSQASTPDGLSWATAFPTVQQGVTAAAPFDQVWVATGAYAPATAGDSVLIMRDDVDLYGGLVGNETSLDQRPTDPFSNPTMLRGDSQLDTTPDSGPVVLGASATLDGFFVAYGTAPYGGGMRNDHVEPTLRNVVFQFNEATVSGGAIASFNKVQTGTGRPTPTTTTTLEDVYLISNQAAQSGGGLFQYGGIINGTRLLIRDNEAATHGGGVRQEPRARLQISGLVADTNRAPFGGGFSIAGGTLDLQADPGGTWPNVIRINTATDTAGGVHLDGILEGVAWFFDNTAPRAGALYVAADGYVDLYDSRFVGNVAEQGAGAVLGEEGALIATTRGHFQANRVTDLAGPGGAGAMAIGSPGATTGLWGAWDNTFVGNVGIGVGGAFAVYGELVSTGNLIVRNNRLVPDAAGEARGAGAAAVANTVRVENALFEGNRVVGMPSVSEGGGLYIQNNASADVYSTTFYDNHAEIGAAIHAAVPVLAVVDGVLWDNGGDPISGGATVIGNHNCSPWGVLPGLTLTGDPYFAGPGGELFLQGPCIGTGSLGTGGTTQPEGTQDTPLDPGFHHPLDGSWVQTLTPSGNDVSWTTHNLAACTLYDGTGEIGTGTSGTVSGDGGPYHLACEDDATPFPNPFQAWSAPRQTLYDTEGSWTFDVPPGVEVIDVEAWGAGGGGGSGTPGAAGGYAQAVIPVTPGETLTVVVGGPGLAQVGAVAVGGYGGGGDSGTSDDGRLGGSGGGLSGIFSGPAPLTFDAAGQARALLVAGGGAGGAAYYDQYGSNAGVGGGTEGGLGSPDADHGAWANNLQTDRTGLPGTATAGGASCTEVTYCVGLMDGAELRGASGGQFGGSGGGGGYFGGGGGAAYFNGSGGSGYVHPAASESWLAAGDYLIPARDWDTQGLAGQAGDHGDATPTAGWDGQPGRVVLRFGGE